MDRIKLGHITQADVYLDGNHIVGRVKEFDIPEFGHKMVTHESLGQIGILDLPSRAVDALKANITFEYADYELDVLFMNPTRANKIQLHSYVDVFGPDGLDRERSHKIITNLTAYFSKSDAMNLKLGESANRKIEATISSFVQKLSTRSVPIIEYDLFNSIYRINGENVWPD